MVFAGRGRQNGQRLRVRRTMQSVMVVVKTPAAVTCSLLQAVILLRDNCLLEC